MTSAREPISTNYRHIAPVVAHQTGDDVLARYWIAAMEQGEPLDISQWMGVKAEMIWKFEYNTHLCDTDC